MTEKMIRDALGNPIPQFQNDDATFSALANGDTAGIDFGKIKMIRDALGDPIPYQYYDVEQGKFVAGTIGGDGGGEVISVNGKKGAVNLKASDIGAVAAIDFDDYKSQDTLNRYASDVDSKEIYRTVDFKRADNSLYFKSTLTNPDVEGNYLTCTWQYYNTTGTAVTKTVLWTFTYDLSGNITSKVVS